MKNRLLFVLLFSCSIALGQEYSFREIPAAPETYGTGTVIARFSDGLGFRYYWASEGLRESDLNYRPGDEARSILETMQHIYGLTRFVLDAVNGDTIRFDQDFTTLSFSELRSTTLTMLSDISMVLRDPDFTVEPITVPVDEEGNVTTMDFWYVLNGPLSDALYHTGQIVSFRRSSGNPMNPDVQVFTGTLRK